MFHVYFVTVELRPPAPEPGLGLGLAPPLPFAPGGFLAPLRGRNSSVP